MTTARTPPHSQPLPELQVATARDVGRRMRDALATLINALPPDARTAHTLATYLAIEGVVARRLVRAAHENDNELRLLTRLPSVQNLRKVQVSAVERGVSPTIGAELVNAIDAFEALNTAVGGGKASLTKRLRATLGAGALPDEPGVTSPEP
jgi:hypothetical protein